MNTSPSILCFSHDPILLETRKWVLGRQFRSDAVSTLHDLEHFISRQHVDVLVLCHTVSEQECRAAGEIVHRSWPDTRILALVSASNACGTLADGSLPALEGPETLLRKVSELAEEPTSHAFAVSAKSTSKPPVAPDSDPSFSRITTFGDAHRNRSVH